MSKALQEIEASDPVDKRVYPTWEAAVERYSDSVFITEFICCHKTAITLGFYQMQYTIRMF